MKKDLNEIAKYEKAIKEKYGDEAIQNPKKFWNQAKEEAFLKDLKKFYKYGKNNKEQIVKDGFTITLSSESPTQHQIKRVCPVCKEYSFNTVDDLYMNKFECCWDCYIQYVENREERWNSGWRPKS